MRSQLDDKAGASIVARLRALGYRITPPRRAVLQVFGAGDEHLSPEEVLAQARRLHPRVGRATVYRTLELLTKLGVTRPIYRGDGRPCFARVEHGHQHAVCSRCQRVVELHGGAFHRLARRVAAQTGFLIQSQLFEFIGLCKRCRRAPAPAR